MLGQHLKMVESEQVPKPFAAELERLAIALKPPRKPAGLQSAERHLARAREQRAALEEAARAATARLAESGVTKLDSEARQLVDDCAEMSARVKRARLEVDQARAAFSEEYARHINLQASSAQAVTSELIDSLDDVASALARALHFGSVNGLPTPRLLQTAPDLQSCIRQMRRALREF